MIIGMSDSPEPTLDSIITKVVAQFSGSGDENTLLTDEALRAEIHKHCTELRASDGKRLIKSGKLNQILQQTDPGQIFGPDVEDVCIL
jgi:hypothetical protein